MARLELTPLEIQTLEAVLGAMRRHGTCWQSVMYTLDRPEREALPAVLDSLTQKLERLTWVPPTIRE